MPLDTSSIDAAGVVAGDVRDLFAREGDPDELPADDTIITAAINRASLFVNERVLPHLESDNQRAILIEYVAADSLETADIGDSAGTGEIKSATSGDETIKYTTAADFADEEGETFWFDRAERYDPTGYLSHSYIDAGEYF